jgi:hypothetical protein
MNTLYIKLVNTETINHGKTVEVFPNMEVHGPFAYVQFFGDGGLLGMEITDEGANPTCSARLKDGRWAVGKDGKGQKLWQSLIVTPNP